jgi:hypothetical protein
MALLRHGGLPKLFTGAYAPSTLGSFLPEFAFGHVRQLDAVPVRWLQNVAAQTPLLNGIGAVALVDIDDRIKQVHGYQKQGSGSGYSGVRGLNALIGTVTTGEAAPVIVGSHLRKGVCGSPRGAGKFVADILATVAAALKPIYQAADAARVELDAFAASPLGSQNPHTIAVFENAWERFTPFLAFPPEVRWVIYTTNAIAELPTPESDQEPRHTFPTMPPS